MDQELAEQLKEHIAANAEYDMAVIESDGDSRMSFHSDDGADGVEEVDAVMGDVPVLVDENSVNRARLEAQEESEASTNEEEEDNDDADDESNDAKANGAKAVMPAQPERRAPSLKIGQRFDGQGNRFRVDKFRRKTIRTWLVNGHGDSRWFLGSEGRCGV